MKAKMSKPDKPKMWSVKYAMAHGGGVVVYLPFNPRKGKCDACGKSIANGEIKVTALHHWWYAYQPKTVKENPILALDNTSELCFYCHDIADALRTLLYANSERISNVAMCVTASQREKFISTLDYVLSKLKQQINPQVAKILGVTK